jgi:uncharacterized membrane protein (DUF485 family)
VTTNPENKIAFDDFYLVSQRDIDKISALISALDLAVIEILESRPVRTKVYREKAQKNYDQLANEIIYREFVEFKDPK